MRSRFCGQCTPGLIKQTDVTLVSTGRVVEGSANFFTRPTGFRQDVFYGP